MKLRNSCFALGLVALAASAGYIYWPREISEHSLSAQLDGAHCRFEFGHDGCVRRGVEPLGSLFIEEHDCDFWAVRCLAEFETPIARQLMIRVLKTKTDIQTCDGVMPIRSYAVTYLGDSGDPSAIAPLRELIMARPTEKLSPGASGCPANEEDLEVIRSAISNLEAN